MPDIIVFGAGGHAKAVIDVIEKAGEYRIAGILDSHQPPGTECYGYEIVGGLDYLSAHRQQIQGGTVAIGDNWTRYRITQSIRQVMPDFRFIRAVHPQASVARGARIGEGSVIMAGAVIGSDAVVGDHCVMYTRSSLDHDSRLGHYATLAPNAATGGQVRIGDYSVISIGASVIHGVIIGEHCVIGAGAAVLHDIPDCSVAYGIPAAIARTRQPGERYL